MEDSEQEQEFYTYVDTYLISRGHYCPKSYGLINLITTLAQESCRRVGTKWMEHQPLHVQNQHKNSGDV